VEASVNVTEALWQIESGAPEKSATRLQPARVTDNVCVVPVQEAALVSVTVTSPFVDPNVTVISLLLGPAAPEVIVAPEGTVHR
jgi:hypothetical protein